MKQFKFDISSFEDLKRHNFINILDHLFDILETEINSGNKIVIERRYFNADPEFLFEITNLLEFNTFKKIWI